MSVAKKEKRKQAAEKRERKERRFSPEPTYASRVVIFAGMFGALLLGAGVYSEWIRNEPHKIAPYLVVAGAVILGVALWRSGVEVGNLRVGDAGVAWEKGGDFVRILWCDLERVSIDNQQVVARGKNASIGFPLEAHPKGAAWLVTEAGRRVPDIVGVSKAELDRLLEPKELDGELVSIDDLQIAGRHCRASGKAIAFERDARLCPVCAEAYLKDQVPKKCLTCRSELGTRAREL